MDELWNVFTQSGSVDDYLKYKENENNANNNEGFDNKGTDNRGE